MIKNFGYITLILDRRWDFSSLFQGSFSDHDVLLSMGNSPRSIDPWSDEFAGSKEMRLIRDFRQNKLLRLTIGK